MPELDQLNPVEKLAAFRAIQEAVVAMVKQAEAEVGDFHKITKGKTFETELGRVTWTKGATRIYFDEDQLLEWAKQNAEWEVETITRVRPSLKKQFVAVDGQVVFQPTGEEVDFAEARTGAEHPTVALTDDAKARAQAALSYRADTGELAQLIMELP